MNDWAQPLVSIIIPTYNRAALIVETIHSIRNQTISDWELIIVDDGSEDDTEAKVAAIEDPRIRYKKIDHCGIGGEVKNIGLSLARGRFIAFNDSDDLWDKTKLEKQLNALATHQDAGFCLTNGYNFRTHAVPVDYFNKKKEGEYMGQLLVPFFRSEIPGFAQVLLFRKECIGTTGLFPERKSFSDLDFILKLAVHFKGVVLYEPLVFRRLHEQNYIHSNWEKSYEEGLELTASYRSLLPRSIFNRAMFRIYIDYGEKSGKFRQRVKAMKQFRKAWSYRKFSIIPLKKILRLFLTGK